MTYTKSSESAHEYDRYRYHIKYQDALSPHHPLSLEVPGIIFLKRAGISGRQEEAPMRGAGPPDIHLQPSSMGSNGGIWGYCTYIGYPRRSPSAAFSQHDDQRNMAGTVSLSPCGRTIACNLQHSHQLDLVLCTILYMTAMSHIGSIGRRLGQGL
jgi:hypothetical protein